MLAKDRAAWRQKKEAESFLKQSLLDGGGDSLPDGRVALGGGGSQISPAVGLVDPDGAPYGPKTTKANAANAVAASQGAAKAGLSTMEGQTLLAEVLGGQTALAGPSGAPAAGHFKAAGSQEPYRIQDPEASEALIAPASSDHSGRAGHVSEEERRQLGYRMLHYASESMGASWAEKGCLGRAMYVYEAPFHLLRALTVPVTPSDSHLSGREWNEGFERIRATLNIPFTASFLVFYCIRRVFEGDYLEKLTPWLSPSLLFLPLPLTVFVFTLPLCVPVWYLTATRMPKWLRNVYVIPAFIASVAWFDVFADEMVECIRTFGFILDLPPSILGVTVLAWGNQVGDFFANRNIAKQGYVKMAMSGCFGEPIFARCFGLGIGFLFGE